MAKRKKRKLTMRQRLRRAQADKRNLAREILGQAQKIKDLDNEVNYYWNLVEMYEAWRRSIGNAPIPRLQLAPLQRKKRIR